MRYSIFFLAMLASLGACTPAKKLTTPAVSIYRPDSLPALPQSEIDIPIKLAGRPLLATADSLFPKEFTSP